MYEARTSRSGKIVTKLNNYVQGWLPHSGASLVSHQSTTAAALAHRDVAGIAIGSICALVCAWLRQAVLVCARVLSYVAPGGVSHQQRLTATLRKLKRTLRRVRGENIAKLQARCGVE